MLYRCLKCDHELAAGCLPTASCGLYGFGLMAFGPTLFWGLVVLADVLIPAPSPPPDAPEPETPWWMWVVRVLLIPVMLCLMVGGAWVLDFLFRTVERLLVRWKNCPGCGSREWSKGYTRGFGL